MALPVCRKAGRGNDCPKCKSTTDSAFRHLLNKFNNDLIAIVVTGGFFIMLIPKLKSLIDKILLKSK